MPRKNRRKYKEIYKPLNFKCFKGIGNNDNILVKRPSKKEQRSDEGIGKLVMYAEVKAR